jgi:hypothetical protein
VVSALFHEELLAALLARDPDDLREAMSQSDADDYGIGMETDGVRLGWTHAMIVRSMVREGRLSYLRGWL